MQCKMMIDWCMYRLYIGSTIPRAHLGLVIPTTTKSTMFSFCFLPLPPIRLDKGIYARNRQDKTNPDP